jgi:predicted metal-dependent HD superfamily phosphohydrolase
MTQINITEIFQRYEEPHRFYHNKDHILRMLSDFKSNLHSGNFVKDIFMKEQKLLIEAILYHDIIYDVMPNMHRTNEEKSAQFYELHKHGEDYIWALTSDSFFVSNLILATQYHFLVENPIMEKMENEDQKFACQVLLDLDLLSFADPYEKFLRTNENIEKEWKTQFSQEAIDKVRKKFIGQLVNRPELVPFKSFKNGKELSEKAIKNINRYYQERFKNV